MKKYIVFSLIVLIFMGILLMNLFSNKNISNNNETTPVYVVKTYGDIIAVFPYGDSIPKKLVNLNYKLLPKKDQDLLKKGIVLYNDAQLIELLEDYEAE